MLIWLISDCRLAIQHDGELKDPLPSRRGGAGQSMADTPPRRAVSMMEARGSNNDDGSCAFFIEEKGLVLVERDVKPM